MKKQFFRVKQLADQTFLKAEKSEILNHEELQEAESKIEALRSALVAINKKLCPNGPIGENGDPEKRLKKCLEYQLGAILLEESRGDSNTLFHKVLKESGDAQSQLAREYAAHEGKVEELVYWPLQKVIDNELPSIAKQKHNLKKYILDKDSASSRYNSTKKETIKEDMEEADTKVEQSRDSLALEMFNLLARENELASYILQLLKLQRGYHESALKSLEEIIPQLEKRIGNSKVKRVFGIPLKEHLRVTEKRLAYPLEVCITALAAYGMEEEGLFRIAGSLSKVKRLKAAIDSGCFSVLIPEYRDMHVLASTLKMYLRELPEPLLTFNLHKEWMHSMQYPENRRVEVVKHLLHKLPEENRDNLAYLIQFLKRLSDHTKNKMSSSNIAIVIAPNLLWDQTGEINVNMGDCVTVNMLVELFIKEAHNFFPEDVSRLAQITISSLVPDEETSSRNGGRSTIEHVDATSMESLSDSPRPNTRKKKPAAPVPPSVPISNHLKPQEDLSQEKLMALSYPVGSLNRPPKTGKVKSTVGVNTDENDLSLSRRRSLTKDDIVPLSGGLSADAKVVTSAVTSVSKAQPVIRPVLQTAEDKSFRTTATHHVGPDSSQRPVAAPRQSLMTDEKLRNSSPRCADAMNKSLNAVDFGDIQMRRAEVVVEQRPTKPEIPARPASLAPAKRSSLDLDPSSLHRTQCSVYNVANKQQPNIVNVQNRSEKIQLGHDVMMAEKEKFLGHSPMHRLSLESKFIDANSSKEEAQPSIEEDNRPAIPPKTLSLTKSNEKLDKVPENDCVKSKSSEKMNEEVNNSRSSMRRANSTHSRTRSDGNIRELSQRELRTPPSPRSLSKPTVPPPPPPVKKLEPDVPPVKKLEPDVPLPEKKSEPESTDF
ncbi:SH3 domain-binding protein 1-like isoform X1 [Euwallacea similis]|uniref:SH3 domain-binding protein 1-like isoform X1 n=1 Tax=Euwallacea similis TaxID=1736056 RepID=UPI0034505996